MSDLQSFNSLLSSINAQLNAGLIRNTNEASSALSQLIDGLEDLPATEQDIRREAEAVAAVLKSLIDSFNRLGREGKDATEKIRRGLESVVGPNKQLAELIKATIGSSEKLGEVLGDVGKAAKTISEKGDIGRFIQQITASIPVIKWFGLALGETIATITKFQDRIQLVNRALIQAESTLGRFGEGMAHANAMTLDLSVGLAEYAQLTGASTEELRGFVGQLASAGFALEEMGIDEQTGHITSLTEALSNASTGFGALSSTLGLARFAGLEFGTVATQMRTQVKLLGDDVGDVQDTFIGLSAAADRSKLSTSILLPILQGMQEQFKFVGIDSERAAMAIGSAAEAASRAGFGPEVGAQVLQRAVSGLIGAPIGIQAFLGQQLGMGGGGLAAGIAFRQDVGQEPLDIAMGVAAAARRFFGGRAVSPEEARANDNLAAIRIGQEQFIMQMMSLSQLEAKSYLDTVSQLEKMEQQGDLDSQTRKEAEDRLKTLSMTEKDYQGKTLTLQKKMARFLELIWATVGRVLLSFVRGAAGTAAGGATDTFLAAVSRGEGIDMPLAEWSKGIASLGKDTSRAAQTFGQTFGSVIRTLGKWLGLNNEQLTAVENRTIAENKAALATLKTAEAIRNLGQAASPREKGPTEALARFVELQDSIKRQTLAQSEAFGKIAMIGGRRDYHRHRGFGEMVPSGRDSPLSGSLTEQEIEATNKLRNSTDALLAFQKERVALEQQLQGSLSGLPAGDMRTQIEAVLGKKQVAQDAWDVMQGGLLYASPGDVVIDAASMGVALSSGMTGDGMGQILGRMQSKGKASDTLPRGTTSPTGGEHEVVFHIKGLDDRMNVVVDERIAYNIEKDMLLPGKLGQSSLRHGSGYRGYS